MTGPPRKGGTTPGWRAGDGKAPPPQVGPRRRWQPGDDPGPGRSGRWVKVVAVFGGLVAVAAGLGYLYTLLREPNPPRLVVVGADPAQDALQLDVPPDYAGWTTGVQLIRWGRAEEAAGGAASLPAKVVADGERPDPLPADPAALDDWVGKLAGGRFARDGRVLVYLGLHGGLDPTGRPFLWVGKGDRLLVADLFAKLADKLAKRDVIVLLDPGRLSPDPLVGRLADGFADRLATDEGVKAALDKHPRLVAICGASAGETAWESEELQATAFGQAVLRGLQGGDEVKSATGAVTGRELFEFVKTATETWSAGNRPTRQTPFLLPAGDAGLERAGRLIATYKSSTPAPPPAVEPEIGRDPLRQLWQAHDELNGRPVPPASYSPLAWRRGRELLLRYQQAVRAGERGAAGVLEPAVRAEFDRVATAAPAVVDRSRTNSVPLAEAFGDAPAAAADAELRKASPTDGLKNLDFAKLEALRDNRPAEALLAGMAHDFYTRRAPGPVPAGWVTAVGVRRAAERAAFGGGPFGERAWPAVRDAVTAADAKRREAEDRLFATPADEQQKAADLLKQAADGYAQATARGQAVREGSALRDRLFADLPFFGRWAAVSGNPDAVQAAVAAWDKAHALADNLDAPGTAPSSAAAEAHAASDRLTRLFRSTLDALNLPPESQAAWEQHERLLASPLVPAELRMKAIDLSRAKTRDWLAGNAPGTPADPGSRAARAKETARILARLTVAALGPKVLHANHAANDQLPRAARLETRLTELNEAKEDWTDKAAGIGDELLGHLRQTKAAAAPNEFTTFDAVEAFERFSRSAVLLGENRTPEPAMVAYALRWQTLLVGLADRTARDHWHDESQEPYWQRAANRFLADARRAVRPDLPRVVRAAAVPADYPDARQLTVRPAAGTPDPFRWTSQRRAAVNFQVAVPADFPADVTGFAVGWRAPPDRLLQWDGDSDRRPLAVAADSGALAGTLSLKDSVGEDAEATLAASARVYFRGQRPDGKLTVSLVRRPERVIKEPLPPKQEAMVAVRADPDGPLGQVAILLDYSGSMKEDVADGREHPDWPQRDTKFSRAKAALREVLAALPKGTPLHVRVFSALEKNALFSGPVFPEPGGLAEVTWDTPDDRRYKALVERLAAYDPHGFTPLVEQIKAAVRDDFLYSGPRAGLPKTLVVLTDGVDEAETDGTGAARAASIERRITRPDGLADQLGRLFGRETGKPVALYVVPFGQTADDAKLSQRLFAGVRDFDPPGRLFPPVAGGVATDLRDKLLEAIFPKLQLRTPTGATPTGLDPSGLPSRLDRSRNPPYSGRNGTTDLRWSPWLPAGAYVAQPNPGRSGPRLTLAGGDAVVLGFAPDGRDGVRVRRELLADYYPAAVSKRQAGDRWSVTSPWPVVDRQTFEAVVFVERVPPHRQTPADDRPADLAADPPDPRGDGHELFWFDLLPAAGAMPPGRLTITRLYGHPAPAWKLERDGWAGADLRGKVRAVIATQDGAAEATRLPDPLRLKLRLARQEPDTLERLADDEIEVRTRIEDRSPDGQQENGASWLVLRIRQPAGQPVLARLVDDRLGRAAATHRYYPPTDGRADYTAAFKVPAAALDQLADVRVNLARVGWALTDANRDRLAVTLEPAAPRDSRAGEPKPVEPAGPGDR